MATASSSIGQKKETNSPVNGLSVGHSSLYSTSTRASTTTTGDQLTTDDGESFDWLPSWKPTSKDKLVQSERSVLNHLQSSYTDHFVQVGDDTFIRTISLAPTASQSHTHFTPLVMIHGFGSGLGCFYKNFDYLHEDRYVYAFDVLGFGRSTRSTFSNETELVENEFIESFEKWREAMGLENMILLGHSLGAFMSTAYSMKYPERVRHLILVDPWGFLEQPEETSTSRNPRLQRYKLILPVIRAYFKVFNPFAMVRLLGPIGPRAISGFRGDLREIFGDDFMNYVYHCNAQDPTGESGFFYLQSNIAYARRPMVSRIDQLAPSLPISMMFGSRSWFDSSSGREVYERRSGSFVDIHYFTDAGHHIHAHLPEVFNRVVNDICRMVDRNGDRVTDGNTRDAFHTH